MALIDALLNELDADAQATRRLIESVGDEQLAWQPHPAAKTLGQLALQTVNQPAAVAQFVSAAAPASCDPSPDRAADLLSALERNLAIARDRLADLDDAALLSAWRLMQRDHELIALPRGALLRALILEQWARQRAQLALYLRALGVGIGWHDAVNPEPNPFAAPEIIRGIR